MDFTKAVEIASFSDHSTAEAAVSLLQSEGIEGAVQSDDAGGEMPNLGMGGHIKLYVQTKDEELARGLLNAESD